MEQDLHYMQEAVRVARRCQGGPADPFVGAVAVKDGVMLKSAHRGEKAAGEHAEFTLLRKLKGEVLSGATIYTTLEPCTVRGTGKTPCVGHLLDRKVARVVIGMLDPNPLVSGRGVRQLRQANIQVDLFPPTLMAEIEELNGQFIRSLETDPVNRAIYEIGEDARHSKSTLQKILIRKMVTTCAEETRSVAEAESDVPDGFGGYLNRFVRLIRDREGTEHVQAFIMLNHYTERQLNEPLMMDFYRQAESLVEEGRLIIDYLYMLSQDMLLPNIPNYLNTIKRFAASIKIVREGDGKLPLEAASENIVIFHRAGIVFVPRRDENRRFVSCMQCRSKEHYQHFARKYGGIEQVSEEVHKIAGRSKLVSDAHSKWIS
jgi:pyrimidine deaminase RibD-like protein